MAGTEPAAGQLAPQISCAASPVSFLVSRVPPNGMRTRMQIAAACGTQVASQGCTQLTPSLGSSEPASLRKGPCAAVTQTFEQRSLGGASGPSEKVQRGLLGHGEESRKLNYGRWSQCHEKKMVVG